MEHERQKKKITSQFTFSTSTSSVLFNPFKLTQKYLYLQFTIEKCCGNFSAGHSTCMVDTRLFIFQTPTLFVAMPRTLKITNAYKMIHGLNVGLAGAYRAHTVALITKCILDCSCYALCGIRAFVVSIFSLKVDSERANLRVMLWLGLGTLSRAHICGVTTWNAAVRTLSLKCETRHGHWPVLLFSVYCT